MAAPAAEKQPDESDYPTPTPPRTEAGVAWGEHPARNEQRTRGPIPMEEPGPPASAV